MIGPHPLPATDDTLLLEQRQEWQYCANHMQAMTVMAVLSDYQMFKYISLRSDYMLYHACVWL